MWMHEKTGFMELNAFYEQANKIQGCFDVASLQWDDTSDVTSLMTSL